MNPIVETAVTALVGLGFWAGALALFSQVTHVHVLREVTTRRNPAIAVLVLSTLIGLAIILAAVAPHGE